HVYKNTVYTREIMVLYEIGYLLEGLNGLFYFSMYKIMYIDTICVILNINLSKSILNVLIFA
ncbi:hypothetical protein, partial [Listeria monocytogenes]|uniref:hypothetical protein n=1 Tax=Listeria monocytogenes TaxID=1639 RepID=UPI0020C5E598